MKLLIDAGNTRIKWVLLEGETWTHLPAALCAQAHTLGAQVATLPDVNEVWVSNVAGAEVARHIASACASRGWRVQFIRAQQQQCGVKNGYQSPGQLGSDRWAALIAAWHAATGSARTDSHINKAALVVNCGTATTIDALSDSGEFLGGLILPGIALMQSGLAANAAQLQHSAGRYAAFPLNTADAMASGALQATCGAIERQYALLGDAQASVLLSGGAAQLVRELIKLPVQLVEDLVLQGLKIIAQEASA
jgi:type III pantothenate kinase